MEKFKVSRILLECKGFANVLFTVCFLFAGISCSDGPSSSIDIPDEDNHPSSIDTLRIVDLGLSVCWADRNVGAEMPEVAGEYIGGNYPNNRNYYNTICDYTNRNYWYMPTKEQMEELYDRCCMEQMTVKDANGIDRLVMKVTGPNGNSIFFPLVGYRYFGENFPLYGGVGYYGCAVSHAASIEPWVAQFCEELREFDPLSSKYPSGDKYYVQIRPVAKKSGEPVSWNSYFGKVPAVSEAVDLGLSVKWAPWNIGADSEEGYGGFYGWGDPTGLLRSTDPADYRDFNDTPGMVRITDIATVKWGVGWHVPTVEQLEELRTQCEWNFIMIKGSGGYRVIGPSGASIFLPMAGLRMGENREFRESSGIYWSKSIKNQFGIEQPLSLHFQKDGVYKTNVSYDFYYGLSVRPVFIE